MSDRDISEILGRVRRLGKGATPAPWGHPSIQDGEMLPDGTGYAGAWEEDARGVVRPAGPDSDEWDVADCIHPNDAALIVAYRADAPALADEVERLQGLVPVWIPTAERMPDLLEWVLVAFVTGAVTRALRMHGGWDLGNSRLFATQDVTHWMPLPAAPEAAETVLATAERGERAMEEASFAIRDEPAADSLDRSELAKRLAVQVVLTKQEKR